MIEIETQNLIIRNHLESDLEHLFDYLSNPEIYIFEPGDPISRAEAKVLVSERSLGDVFFAVVQKKSNIMIGHLYFSQSEPKCFLTWQLGFIFNPKFQKQGFCTEASNAIINYAFEKLKAHKIVAFCNPKNVSSWKVLENIGMEREGFFKEKAFFRKDSSGNPLWHDCYAYGLLNNIRMQNEN